MSASLLTPADGPAVVIRLGALGDVALATGVLEYWRLTKGLHVVFMTRDRFAPLFLGHPAVTRTIQVTQAQSQGAAWVRTARSLAGEFPGHLLIDLHGSVRSRTLSLLWNGPVARYPTHALQRRVYLRWRSIAARRALLAADVPRRYAMALEPEPPSAPLRPRVFLTTAEVAAAHALLEQRSIGGRIAALHPYATHPLKTWPRPAWNELVRSLAAAGWDWVALGRDPNPFLGAIDAARDLTNRTDLRTTCSLLACASVLITADSGPMHLAEAVGTPLIALFGPTAREWGFYPGGSRDVVMELPMECRPCSLHGTKRIECPRECLEGITPAAVVAQLQRYER
ncbi:MAG: glycosyltransferase family 9 protein [Candidatus Eisenbacteria bacterium]|nr:glycosyltransferase family 9 protein [Candidatus Eisenbacteria bacterium]